MAFSAWGQTTRKPVTAANTLVVSSVKTTGIMITGCDFAFQCHTDISTVLSILPPPLQKKPRKHSFVYKVNFLPSRTRRTVLPLSCILATERIAIEVCVFYGNASSSLDGL